MPRPSDRGKKKKFKRTPRGKTKKVWKKKKPGKQKCAICKKILHGVPHGKTATQRKKLSKSKKRPSAFFGGVICGKCRAMVMEESAKIVAKVKKINDVDIFLKPWVEKTVKRIEVMK